MRRIPEWILAKETAASGTAVQEYTYDPDDPIEKALAQEYRAAVALKKKRQNKHRRKRR